jgi:hypothetical protein
VEAKKLPPPKKMKNKTYISFFSQDFQQSFKINRDYYIFHGVEFKDHQTCAAWISLSCMNDNNNNKEFTCYELSLLYGCHNHIQLLKVGRSYSITHRRRNTM